MRSPLTKRSRERIEQNLDREVSILRAQLRKALCQPVDKFRFSHNRATDYCCFNLALSKAPRLVVPALPALSVASF